MATVADRLGHGSAAFTLSTYAHAVKELHSTAADQLKAILDLPTKAKKRPRNVQRASGH